MAPLRCLGPVTMGLLGSSIHWGERTRAGLAMLAVRPDINFQGRQPASLTCFEMPTLPNGAQLGQLRIPACAGGPQGPSAPGQAHCCPSPPARPCPSCWILATMLSPLLHPLVLRDVLFGPFRDVPSPPQQFGTPTDGASDKTQGAQFN